MQYSWFAVFRILICDGAWILQWSNDGAFHGRLAFRKLTPMRAGRSSD